MHAAGSGLGGGGGADGCVGVWCAMPGVDEGWEAAFELAAIVGSSGDAIVSRSLDGTIRTWNPAAEVLYGYRAAEVVGRRISLIVPADRVGEERVILDRVVAGERIEDFETERLRKDGSRVGVWLTVSAVRGRGGEVVGASVIARDVSARLVADAARQELDVAQRFRSAFMDAPFGMAMVGLDRGGLGVVLESNAELRAMTGCGEGQLSGMGFELLVHDDDRESFLGIARAVAAGQQRAVGREMRLRDGVGAQPLWALLTVSLMYDGGGEPLCLLVLAHDMTDRRRFDEQLQHLADHDWLTGLLNRRRFEIELERQVAYMRRYGTSIALVLLDLDNFKYANDTFGHKVGDDAIATTARVLRGRLRSTDLLGRLGGDEFAIVFPETDLEQATAILEGVLGNIRTEVRVDGRDTRFTASAGLALASRESALTGEELLVGADVAMYEAKRTGRDRLVVYSDELRRRTDASQSWVERIRQALERDDFLLYAQPILNLQSGQIDHHELLIRMRSASGELILPGHFLDVAESFNLIGAIDRWVVGQAIDLLAAHRRAGSELCLEVNLSGRSVSDPQIALLVEQAVAERRLDPSKLIFELTETAAIENMFEAKRFVERMRGLGCGFALDDFGAGLGSFYYLKHLPFDYLKIDGEFIKKLLTATADQLVVQSLAKIASGLGKRTIAEFVGDEQTMALLRSYGIDYSQGFHIGHPQPLCAPPATGGAI